MRRRAGGLNEAALDEGCGIDNSNAGAAPGLATRNTAYTYTDAGLCRFKVVPAVGGIDWNVSGLPLQGVSLGGANIAPTINDWPGGPMPCDTIQGQLKGYNDWQNLRHQCPSQLRPV